MRQLGEAPEEFEAHCRRFARVFAPENSAEEKVVRLIATTVPNFLAKATTPRMRRRKLASLRWWGKRPLDSPLVRPRPGRNSRCVRIFEAGGVASSRAFSASLS
jgi:hypothetical protein